MINNHEVFIIMAADKNMGIGKSGKLPWKLKKELKYFQETSSKTKDLNKQNMLIMGRKTWESIPNAHKPLINRLNVVLSRNKNYLAEGALVKQSLKDALSDIRNNIDKIFIIGGAKIFEEAIDLKELDGIYLTKIKHEFNCDTFLNSINDKFTKSKKKGSNKDGNIEYDFMFYYK